MRNWMMKVRVLLPLMILAASLGSLPAGATHEPTLVQANEASSTFAISGSLTDGEYVVWTGSSTSVHERCSTVRGARLDDRDPFNIARIADGGPVDIDDGVVIFGTEARSCSDSGPESVEAGVHLYDLAAGDMMTLMEGEDVVDVLIDGSLVAWVVAGGESEDIDLSIWAMDLNVHASPVEIDVFFENPETIELLDFVDGELIWVNWIGPNGGDVARAAIGADPSGIWTLHDTTEVVIADETRVTLTNGRPLYHYPDSGEVRWLGDGGASNLATDGRYVFWTVPGENRTEVVGYDLESHARFNAWEVQSDEPNVAGQVLDISVDGGGLAWTRHAYNTWMTAIHAAPLADRLPSGYEPDPGTTDPNWTYYAESGHYLASDFRDYWSANGGLPVFGYPMTSEFDDLSAGEDQPYAAQFTERQRLEWHPENAGTPYIVLLGRLGETLLEQQGRDWTSFPKADPSADHYFPETGHAIAPEFWGFWSSHGLDFGDPGVSFAESLALFGYPLSEPMMETNADGDMVQTQYFERAVFELHPDNPEPSQVLLRRLGAEVLAAWDW